MIELFHCERLSASITKAACEKNRNRQEKTKYNITKLFACQGCSGLGAITEKVEVINMGSPGKCKHPGCTKFIKLQGYCTTHLREHGINPKTGKPLSDAVKAVAVKEAKQAQGGGKSVSIPAAAAKPVTTEETAAIDMSATIEAVKLMVPEPDPKVDVNEALLVNLGWLVDESFEVARQKVIASLSSLACPRERIRAALKVAADLDIVAGVRC